MNCIRNATLSVVTLALGAALGAGPQDAEAGACSSIPGEPRKKCIKKRDLDKGAVSSNRLKDGAVTEAKLKDGALTETKLSDSLQAHVSERESFYVTLDGNGSTAPIATHGPLSYSLRCIVNDAGRDRVEIVGTSTQGPWYAQDESDDDTSTTNALSANQTFTPISEDADTNIQYFDTDIDEDAMIGPGGFYMAIVGETTGLGLNIYGHRCTAVGHVLKVTDPSVSP